VVAGLAALAGFVVLVTPEPSVVRAATMSAVAMLALLLGRRGSGLALLALAVCVLLAADPWLALSLGFALSVAATGALLVLAPPLARGLGRFLPASLALALAVPLSAQLVCSPLIVLVSPGVAVYGVPANLLAAPAAPVATVLGLAACLAAPVPVLQAGLTALTWLPAAWKRRWPECHPPHDPIRGWKHRRSAPRPCP
jgi:competence protein ComEC